MKYRGRDTTGASFVAGPAPSRELDVYKQRCRDDFAFFAKNELQIEDVNSATVPLAFNVPQRRFAHAVAARQARKLPVLFVVCKSRQWGCSTEVTAWLVGQMVARPGYKVLVVVHTEDAVPAFARMYRKMLNNLSPAWKCGLLRDSDAEIVLDNGSLVVFHTAGSKATAKGTGRSQTFQALHASEVPFWADPAETFRAAKACVHLKGRNARDVEHKAIFVESSPNGRDAVFFDQYDRAKKGQTDFEPFFVPWHECEWYSVPVTPEQQKRFDAYVAGGGRNLLCEAGLLEDEEDRIGRFELTAGQWAWWCYTLQNGSPGGDVEKMRVEYPDDDSTCFAGSEGTIFADKYMHKHVTNMRPGECGECVDGKWRPERLGRFRMWHAPVKGCSYLATCDVASGNQGARDWTVFKVWERAPGGGLVECAKLRTQLPPEDAADHAMDLCALYHEPKVAVEVNDGYGAAFQGQMRRRGYANFYRRQVTDKLVGPGGVVTDDLGWWTTSKTRSHMVSAARSYLHRRKIRVHDPDLFSEIATFVRNPKNSRASEAAAPGKNDDEVIVMCIACYVDAEQAPVLASEVEPEAVVPTDEDGRPVPAWRLDPGPEPAKPENRLSHLRADDTWRTVR